MYTCTREGVGGKGCMGEGERGMGGGEWGRSM